MICNHLKTHWTMCKLIGDQNPAQRENAEMYFKTIATLRSVPAVTKKATSYALRRLKK